MNLSFQRNDFDSGLLADSVANLTVDDPATWKSVVKESLFEHMEQQKIDLVIVKSPSPLPEVWNSEFKGCVERWTTVPETLRTSINRFTGKVITRPLEERDWAPIEDLLQFTSLTRFSADKKIGTATVQIHKLKLLKTHIGKSPDNAQVSLSASGEVSGFHAGYVAEGIWNLYELLTSPIHRNGFTAFQLIGDLYRRQDSKGIQGVETSIYSDNLASKSFFSKLGLAPNGKKSYFYHVWAEVPLHNLR